MNSNASWGLDYWELTSIINTTQAEKLSHASKRCYAILATAAYIGASIRTSRCNTKSQIDSKKILNKVNKVGPLAGAALAACVTKFFEKEDK